MAIKLNKHHYRIRTVQFKPLYTLKHFIQMFNLP
jgi:hypothetical protein